MLVFLTWSGDRSKAVAETFAKWIVQVIQAVEPWISLEIEKGTRWNEEVAGKLEESRVGIICLTKENPNERWILFESGAIAKTKDARVCTLLLDIDPIDVQPPLGGFQHTTALDKNDVRKLLQTINTAVAKYGERELSESVLDDVFETNWPRLSEDLEKIASQKTPSGIAKRSERDILQEILEIVRGQQRLIAAIAKGQFIVDVKETPKRESVHHLALELAKATEIGSDHVGSELAKAYEVSSKNALRDLLYNQTFKDELKALVDSVVEAERNPKASRDECEKHDT